MIGAQRYGALPENLKIPLSNIGKSAERLIGLVSGLLVVSRLESGNQKPQISTFNINPLINEVIEELKPIAAPKNINLKTGLGEDKRVKADLGFTRQILENLIGNAMKFTPAGEVVISTKNIGRVLNIYVVDTGMGIAKNDQPLIFDKFLA